MRVVEGEGVGPVWIEDAALLAVAALTLAPLLLVVASTVPADEALRAWRHREAELPVEGLEVEEEEEEASTTHSAMVTTTAWAMMMISCIS